MSRNGGAGGAGVFQGGGGFLVNDGGLWVVLQHGDGA
jgi:hypothetical protein